MVAIYHLPRAAYPHRPLCGTTGFTACVEDTQRKKIESGERSNMRMCKSCTNKEH